MDGEFEKLKPLMPSIECSTTAAKEHVSEAEQTIRTLKERMRGLLAMLPFTHIPKQMKIKFVYFMGLWLNAFRQVGDLANLFAKGAAGSMAARLQEALSYVAGNVL